jgi:hypothetical protein
MGARTERLRVGIGVLLVIVLVVGLIVLRVAVLDEHVGSATTSTAVTSILIVGLSLRKSKRSHGQGAAERGRPSEIVVDTARRSRS